MKLVEKSFKKLIVIMPAYNEAEKIPEAITNIQSVATTFHYYKHFTNNRLRRFHEGSFSKSSV